MHELTVLEKEMKRLKVKLKQLSWMNGHFSAF